MSRRPPAPLRAAGRVTLRQAAAGLTVGVLLSGGLIGLCRWLVLDPMIEVTLEPRQPVSVLADECPEPAALPPEPVAVSSDDLLVCPDLFDGRVVAYTGEAVAAVLLREDHAWLQLNDDRYALDVGPLPEHRTPMGANTGIPVAVPLDVAGSVRHAGDHWTYGDVLEVTGEFLRADPGDGGGPAIRADEGAVIREGRPVAHPLSTRKLVAAAVFAVATLGMALELLRWRRNR